MFLAMAVTHMMPESAEIYAEWAEEQCIENAFPLPYVMFFVGYFLILAIDRVAAKAYHARSHDDDAEKSVTRLRPSIIGAHARKVSAKLDTEMSDINSSRPIVLVSPVTSPRRKNNQVINFDT